MTGFQHCSEREDQLTPHTCTSAKHLTLSHMISLSQNWGVVDWIAGPSQWARNWLDGHCQGVVVNGPMSKQRPLLGVVPQGLGSGLAHFSTSVGSVDSGIDSIFISFPDHSELFLPAWRGGRPSTGTLAGFTAGPVQTSLTSKRPSGRCCT